MTVPDIIAAILGALIIICIAGMVWEMMDRDP
jgi:hypothetical protein